MNHSVYTVGQINNYIKNMIQQDFLLNSVSVKGEVSNCKYHTSGHLYFSLKDKSGVIKCVMFAGNRSGLKFRLEEGQNVIVLGRVDVYEVGGQYQLYARQIILEGTGLLYQRYEQLKKELEERGLFDAMYKQPIPAYALKIGVCTAATGAAIHDIITVSKRRNPYVQIYLYPSLVQGAEAAQDIVNGIRCLDRMNLDVIIVGRGGGSIEDLWAFNEEIVAQAIFDCRTPVISAVGHETDTTIADFVADQRAATPSAAAELATFEYYEFENKLHYFRQMLRYHLNTQMEQKRSKTVAYENILARYSPKNRLQTRQQQLCELETKLQEQFYLRLDKSREKLPVYAEQMQLRFHERLNSCRHRMEIYAEKLKGLSPLNKITKGFGFLSDSAGTPIHTVRQISEGDALDIIIQDGKIRTVVKEKESSELFQ